MGYFGNTLHNLFCESEPAQSSLMPVMAPIIIMSDPFIDGPCKWNCKKFSIIIVNLLTQMNADGFMNICQRFKVIIIIKLSLLIPIIKQNLVQMSMTRKV